MHVYIDNANARMLKLLFYVASDLGKHQFGLFGMDTVIRPLDNKKLGVRYTRSNIP